MMPKLDPKKMQKIMSQMGIKNEPVDASRVVIEKSGGGKIVVDNPSVTRVTMQDQKTFQVSGDVSEDEGASASKEGSEEKQSDLDLVVAQTGASAEEAKKALQEAGGDIAQAIMKLKKE